MLTLTLSVIVFTRETGVEIDRHSVEGQVSRLDERYL